MFFTEFIYTVAETLLWMLVMLKKTCFNQNGTQLAVLWDGSRAQLGFEFYIIGPAIENACQL